MFRNMQVLAADAVPVSLYPAACDGGRTPGYSFATASLAQLCSRTMRTAAIQGARHASSGGPFCPEAPGSHTVEAAGGRDLRARKKYDAHGSPLGTRRSRPSHPDEANVFQRSALLWTTFTHIVLWRSSLYHVRRSSSAVAYHGHIDTCSTLTVVKICLQPTPGAIAYKRTHIIMSPSVTVYARPIPMAFCGIEVSSNRRV